MHERKMPGTKETAGNAVVQGKNSSDGIGEGEEGVDAEQGEASHSVHRAVGVDKVNEE